MGDFSKYDDSCEPLFSFSSLSEYESKRNLNDSKEPKAEKEKENKYRFVIQLHKADRAGEHFDLRLENDNGTLSSWSIPKHHMPKNNEKLLAIKTEDHPISYINFKGKIEKGYGKGKVEIYDKGTYEEVKQTKSLFIFSLKGKKERGTFNLFKTKGDNWLITKHKKESNFIPLSIRNAANFIDKRKEESGNTTYIYSKEHIDKRNQDKEKKLRKLGKSLKDLRKVFIKDLSDSDLQKSVTALAVGIIDETYIRVGNEESVTNLKHYGLTTLLKKHVSFSGSKATLKYTGKSGVNQNRIISNSKMVSLLKKICSGKKSEDRIFQDDEYSVRAKTINKYLKSFEITAKDIRGFHANSEMISELKKIRKGKLPKDEKEKTKILKEEFKQALETTAEKVGHQASTLKNQYLIPSIEPDYIQDGKIGNLADDKKVSASLEFFIKRIYPFL